MNEKLREYHRNYYLKHRKRKLAHQKKHYQENKQKRLEYAKKYYSENKEAINAYHKQWAKETGYITFMHGSNKIDRIDAEIARRLNGPKNIFSERIIRRLKDEREKTMLKLIPYLENIYKKKLEGSDG